MYLSLPVTLIALAVVIAVFVLSRWRAAQPVRPERGPRMVPWTLIAVAMGGIAVILVAHLFELGGMDLSQGRRF